MNTEHVDIGLARFSDWAFTASVVVLTLAIGGELARASRRRRREVRVREEGLLGARAHGREAERRVAAHEQEALVEVARERVHSL